MQLNSENINILHSGYTGAYAAYGADKNNNSDRKSLTFTGAREKATDVTKEALSLAKTQFEKKAAQTGYGAVQDGAGSLFQRAKNGAASFVRKYFTHGTDIHYTEKNKTLELLRANFGETFEDCFIDIDNYNSMASGSANNKVLNFLHKHTGIPNGEGGKFIYKADEYTDTITFHEDSFLKKLCLGVKEFTVGQVLDLGVAVRNGYRKLDSKFGAGDMIASTNGKTNFINRALDRRVAENNARDAFYRLSGVFKKAGEGIDEVNKHKMNLSEFEAHENIVAKIKSNIEGLASGSITQASKKVGKYNTKTERAWNRLGTGFVSATFAATDFYNISMLQNDDPEKANKSGQKRFMQDMRRQALTAGITYIVLGALQESVNKSILAGALSLGGVTLISEVLSRKMGGIPLKPLSPEEAAKYADKQEKKRLKKEQKEQNDTDKTEKDSAKPLVSALSAINIDDYIKTAGNGAYVRNSQDDVFNIFADKLQSQGKMLSFTAKSSGSDDDKQAENSDGKKKTSGIASKVAKGALAVVGASLAIGFLRTKNVLGIDDFMKSVSKKYNDILTKLSSKRLIMPEDDVDGFLDYLTNNNFKEQYKILDDTLGNLRKHGRLSGQAPVVKKYIPEKELNPTGFYYDLGYVESKGKKTLVHVLTYPINTIGRFMSNVNHVIRKMFGASKPEGAGDTKISKRAAAEFMEKYAGKYRDAVSKDETFAFKKELEDAFTRHFSEANSKNKNTTLAMMSRFLITIISGYFFVNDYRNEVLIESKGQDVERANSTMKERIGHKAANFVLNSLFMDIFNTTFESIYLGSVPGATAVAMATEFTNETAVRASICTPTSKMSRDELIQYENERLNDDGLKGNYYRAFMKLTGKKPLSEKAKS